MDRHLIKTVSIRFNRETKSCLDSYAAQTGIPRNQLITRAVDEWMQKLTTDQAKTPISN